MKNKPLIISVISILCILEPAMKVFYYKFSTNFDFDTIFSNLSQRDSFKEVLDFWLIYPLAGLFLLKIRKWSYFTVMGIFSYIIYTTATYEKFTWPFNSHSPFFYNFLTIALTVCAFIYFLLPLARQPFFDRRVRFWETKTRYDVIIRCRLMGKSITFPTNIRNISQSGVFLEESSYMTVGDEFVMEFDFSGYSARIPVKIIHHLKKSEHRGFGAEFQFRTLHQRLKMKKIMDDIKASGIVYKNPRMKVAA